MFSNPACVTRGPFLEGPRKAVWLESCFIHIFLIRTEVPYIQDVLGAHTSLCLDTDELKLVYGLLGLSRNGLLVDKAWYTFAELLKN